MANRRERGENRRRDSEPQSQGEVSRGGRKARGGSVYRTDEWESREGRGERTEELGGDFGGRIGSRGGPALAGRDYAYRNFEGHLDEVDPRIDSHRGRGPKGYRRSDDRIREEVCERLTEDPIVDARELEVAVEDGEVTLSGTVTERPIKRRAEDVAESVSGVKDIHNRIRVAPANVMEHPEKPAGG